MTEKQTYSQPAIFEFEAGQTSKQIATSGVEVSALKLIASGAASAVALYDNADGNPQSTEEKWFLEASTTDNDIQSFPNPLAFKKGIFAVLEQGVNFNAKICIALIPANV